MSEHSKNLHDRKEPFGRPKGTGKFCEATEVLRVPSSQKPVIVDFLSAYEKARKANTDLDESFYVRLVDAHLKVGEESLSLPLAGTKLDAGFGNMVEDWLEDELDIIDYLIDDKEMTFFKIIGGLSMNLAGLLPGFVVCVNKGKEAKIGDIVMAELNGKETIKFLGKLPDGRYQLIPQSTEPFPTITIGEYDEFRIKGVIDTWFVRRNKKR